MTEIFNKQKNKKYLHITCEVSKEPIKQDKNSPLIAHYELNVIWIFTFPNIVGGQGFDDNDDDNEFEYAHYLWTCTE